MSSTNLTPTEPLYEAKSPPDTVTSYPILNLVTFVIVAVVFPTTSKSAIVASFSCGILESI